MYEDDTAIASASCPLVLVSQESSASTNGLRSRGARSVNLNTGRRTKNKVGGSIV